MNAFIKKAGVVAIIGRPNVGKSTLLNYLVGEKVAIVSPIPQTTRNQIRAILNEKRGQIVFLDTPGMHVSKHALDRAMISAINDSLSGVDVVIHLVDATERLGEEEGMVMERLNHIKAPIILGLNKIDRPVKYLNDYIEAWEKKLGGKVSAFTDRVMPVPLSALDGTNVDRLVDELFERLPEGEPLYPEDILTDFPRQLTIQDIIREKLLMFIRDELPFSVAVHADEITDRSVKLTYVKASILVERDSQKAIVIGKKGAILKKVGEASRKELEDIYGKKFYLDLWVKVDENWKQDHGLLRRMGYLL
jgi:GTP-binding protein Era